MIYRRGHQLGYGAAGSTLIAFAWLYLSPTFATPRPHGFLSVFENPLVRDPLERSLAVGTAASVLSVVIGFALANMLRGVDHRSGGGYVLALLMLPVLVGDLVSGFSFKSATMAGSWFTSLFAERPQWAVLGTIVGMQTWQYATLCTYLFWLRLIWMEQFLDDFAVAGGLSRSEYIRDILWPKCRGLAFVLSLTTFFSGALESAKSWLVFKVSPGTGTSLVSHAIWEQYQQRLLATVEFARDDALHNCEVAALAIIVTAVCVAATTDATIALALKSWTTARRNRRRVAPSIERRSLPGPEWPAWCIAIATVLPFFAPALIFHLSAGIEWGAIAAAAALAAGGAALSLFAATLCTFFIRISSPGGLARFTRSAVCVLVLLLMLRGIPSLAFILSGYELFSHITNSQPITFGSWLIGQALLQLPLLGAFGLWLHTQVTRQELEFQQMAGLSLVALARRSFLQRFPLDYCFFFLFAWSAVWNESTLNRVVSDSIPTFIDLLSRHLSARPDFSKSATICLVSVVLGVTAVALWISAQSNSYRSQGKQ